MMNAGKNLKDIYNRMMAHGMNVPVQGLRFAIPDARRVLEAHFTYFLSLHGIGFEWQPEYDQIVQWLSDNKGKGLFLFGDCGRGKSFLSRYVLPSILLEHKDIVMKSYDIQQVNRQIDELLTRRVLSIDDIGTEDISNVYGNRRLAFAEIMDAAEKYGKLLVISTNLTRDQVVEIYGKRVYERIIATTQRVEFKGKSLRR